MSSPFFVHFRIGNVGSPVKYINFYCHSLWIMSILFAFENKDILSLCWILVVSFNRFSLFLRVKEHETLLHYLKPISLFVATSTQWSRHTDYIYTLYWVFESTHVSVANCSKISWNYRRVRWRQCSKMEWSTDRSTDRFKRWFWYDKRLIYFKSSCAFLISKVNLSKIHRNNIYICHISIMKTCLLSVAYLVFG